MVLNKNGQVIFFSLMLGIVIIVLALALATPIKERVEEAMNPSNLDCGNSSISNFDKGACLVADLTMFHFIAALIIIAGAIIGARIVFT